ncbi:MAG: hypothetical protein QOK20_394 [Acidimicrobiaceae bacterium]|nr:hypothetical protein [Acidimicrobiaceae bacterium]
MERGADWGQPTGLSVPSTAELARNLPKVGVASVAPIVPVVDITGWDEAPAGTRQRIAGAVDDACRRVGFLQITGHGIAAPIIERALSASDRFFASPLEDKLHLRPDRPEINRGYAPLGSEALAYSLGVERPPDQFEAFNIGASSLPPGGPDPSLPLFAPNLWPSQPGYREALWDYFQGAIQVSRTLLDIFAVALDLPAGWFGSFTDHSTLTMRSIRYERRPGSSEGLGMSEHTDYGIVTVLYADAIAGLQIIGPEGGWHDVVALPGALLVNLGDLLAQWTNDRWRSTIHRVQPPPPGTVRRSMAMFNDGNHDALIEVLPSCVDTDHPPRYPPVTAGDHLAAKLLGPRSATRADATDTTAGRLPAD